MVSVRKGGWAVAISETKRMLITGRNGMVNDDN